MPRYPHCKLIVAMGNYGQIGDKGHLPWRNPDDLRHFKTMTMGGLCVLGKRTAQTLPDLPGRDIYRWRRTDDPETFAEANTDRNVWIIGGASIYRRWLPFVGMSIITHIDYDKQCDTYMPFLWRFPSKKVNA